MSHPNPFYLFSNTPVARDKGKKKVSDWRGDYLAYDDYVLCIRFWI